MRKNDWILAGGVLVIALAFYLINSFVIHSSGASVTVTVDGDVYARIPWRRHRRSTSTERITCLSMTERRI